MLWPGTKHASMDFKEKYRKLYAQNSFRMFSLRDWRTRRSLARKTKTRVTPFGIFGTSHNNLHQDCVTKQLRFQWFCCIGCKRPWRVHAMVLTFECKVRRYLTDLLNCASNTFQLISLFENRRHAKTKLEHSDALLHIWKRPLLAFVS